jgi:TRAP-type C4-dicarboxylate transport system substrate-binding protein
MEQKQRGRPPKVKPTDWEELSKKLQKALEKEIDEGELLRKELVIQLREAQQQAHDNSFELIKAKGIIEYLEVNLEELHKRFEDSGYKNLPPIFRNGE